MDLGDHGLEVTAFRELVSMSAVGADCVVFALQRGTGADGDGFLANAQMDRAAHELFGIVGDDGLFGHADADHLPQKTDFIHLT